MKKKLKNLNEYDITQRFHKSPAVADMLFDRYSIRKDMLSDRQKIFLFQGILSTFIVFK